MSLSETSQVSIENHRGMYILIGYVMALSFMYIMLEWRHDGIKDSSFFDDEYVFREDFVPIIWDIPEEEIPPLVIPLSQEDPVVNTPETKIADPSKIVVVENDNVSDQTGREEPKNNDQAQETPTEEIPPVRNIDSMPEFPGGIPGLRSYVFRNLIYPFNDLKAGIDGTVVCSFVILEDGRVSDVTIIQGKTPDMDAEAKRIILQMPKWKPGTKEGKNIPSRCILPIVFRLK